MRSLRPIATAASIMLCAATLTTPTALANPPKLITAAVPPEGSSGYVLMAAMSKAITEKTPIEKVTLQTFSGAVGWPARMQTGEVGLGAHCGFKQVEEAYFGKGPFGKVGPQRNVRNMITGHGLPFAMTVIDKNITKIQDLRGKRIFALLAHEDHKIAVETLIRMAGLQSGSSIRLIPVRSAQEAIQGLLTGRADGLFHGLIPALTEVQQGKGLYMIPLSDEVRAAIIAAEPVWGQTVVPANAPPLKPETATPTIEVMCGIAAGAQLDEATVYLLTKTIFEQREEWRKAHPLGVQWTPQRALQIMNAPYHNGAVRYYKEIGVWTGEHDKLQQKLLAQ